MCDVIGQSDSSWPGERLTCAYVVPVRVIGCELLEGAGFDDVDPCGDLKFSRAFKMGRVGGDECLGAAPVPGQFNYSPGLR